MFARQTHSRTCSSRLGFIFDRLPLICAAALCAAAGGSAPTYTLIVGPRVPLTAPVGGPANAGYIPVGAAIGDLNGDGLPDIVMGFSGVPPAVYLNNGTSTPFQGVTGVLAGPYPTPNAQLNPGGAVVLADVNGDGHLDIAASGFNAPNMVYLNNGTSNPFGGGGGIAIGTGDVAYIPALGDVNGDGYVDMAVANSNHVPSRLYLTQGAPLTGGTYTTVQIGTDLGYGTDAVIADVNGDGKPDLILTYEILNPPPSTDPSGIAIYLNNGTSDPFNGVTPIRLLVGQTVLRAAVADLNGDGHPDLVATADGTLSSPVSNLYVFLNTDSPSEPFVNSQSLLPDADLGGQCGDVSVKDVNGDGLPDLLFTCEAPSAKLSPPPTNPANGAIYLNNGTANPFENVTPVDIPAMDLGTFGYAIATGTLVTGGVPDVLIADADGFGGYYPITHDQNPQAENDSTACAINGSAAIAVLANDSAGPGQKLEPSSVTIVTPPQHGTATVDSASGSVTYQPVSLYSGNDSFQYTVADGLGARSNVATVSIRVQPAPVASNDTGTLQANQSITLNVLAHDTSAGGSLNPSSIKIVVAPTHGTAVVTNGEVVYTPTTGYAGLDTFQYTVQDNLGTVSNAATVSLSITAAPSKGEEEEEGELQASSISLPLPPC